MLWKVSSCKNTTGAPVYLNVYDLTPLNSYMHWLGLGIYHSAIEAYNVEYAFGAHDHPTSGVFEVEPHHCPGFKFRKSILIGTTSHSPKEFQEFMKQVASEYSGDSYHLIVKNCNHFCDDICLRLTGSSIPGWVNRIARLGSVCNCVLPETLQINTVPHTPEYRSYGCLERCSRGAYDRLIGMPATVAPRKKDLSLPTVYLPSSFNSRIISLDWVKSNIFKDRAKGL